jgi:hypothetical protein
LKEAGIEPAPDRSATTWADFLCSQADALLACDVMETVTLSGARPAGENPPPHLDLEPAPSPARSA